ncbi:MULTISPECIES: hypothetical protein [Eisenbergiella]|nr:MULTISPECIES: hypothetical protein [Eisenbergiella]
MAAAAGFTAILALAGRCLEYKAVRKVTQPLAAVHSLCALASVL